MYLLASTMTGTMGSVSAMLATAMAPQSTLAYDTKFMTATGAVEVWVRVMIRAKKKSFQASRKP